MSYVVEHSDRCAVALLLRVLDIESSTFYGWVKQVEQLCDRDLVDLGLVSNIYEIWTTSGRTYGANRSRWTGHLDILPQTTVWAQGVRFEGGTSIAVASQASAAGRGPSTDARSARGVEVGVEGA